MRLGKVLCAWLIMSRVALANPGPCPAAQYLPQVTIDTLQEPAVPIEDKWQVLWHQVPISDAQLAMLAGNDPMIDRTRKEMVDRGLWVYLGFGGIALGTAISSTGWMLFGRNKISQGASLTAALGGLGLALGGLILATESIQRPLEPHLAPTPVHRLSRDEARELVAAVNKRLYDEICKAADVAAEPARLVPE